MLLNFYPFLELCCHQQIEKNLKIKQITEITNQAMSGNINFTKALNLRLQLLKINKTDVVKITNHLSKSISESINSNIDLIRLISENIWIVSGGFKDIIGPIVKNFGIKKSKILANEFIYNKYNQVIGCNEQNDLYKSKGKISAIKNLKLSGKLKSGISEFKKKFSFHNFSDLAKFSSLKFCLPSIVGIVIKSL